MNRRRALASALALAAAAAQPSRTRAQDGDRMRRMVRDVVEEHVLPRIGALAGTGAALAETAGSDCAPQALRPAWNAAFDAFVRASHLDFGPMESDNRFFSLYFWPDSRGMGQRALKALLLAADPAVDDAAAFATGSVAVRGFMAMEYLLYDPELSALGSPDYRCRLLRAQSLDIARVAASVAADWRIHAPLMETAGDNDTYRSLPEAAQQLYTAFYVGLEFTANNRLGQPLGSFDRPRPSRAEARRSGRSLRNVVLSLESLRDLGTRLAAAADDAPDLRSRLGALFDRALTAAAALADDPAFAAVDDPMARFRVESLQTTLFSIRDLARATLAPALGVAEGFNAGDGD